jgi:hypothetical protein
MNDGVLATFSPSESFRPHRLLRLLAAQLAASAPLADWRAGECIAVGVATELSPEWLIATCMGDNVEVSIGTRAPRGPRAAVALTANAATRLLAAHDSIDGGTPWLVSGDVDFLKRALTSSLGHTDLLGALLTRNAP